MPSPSIPNAVTIKTYQHPDTLVSGLAPLACDKRPNFSCAKPLTNASGARLVRDWIWTQEPRCESAAPGSWHETSSHSRIVVYSLVIELLWNCCMAGSNLEWSPIGVLPGWGGHWKISPIIPIGFLTKWTAR